MDKTLEELKAEADVLGVEYSKNIGATKLSEKIEAYYESQAAGDSVKVYAEPAKEEAPVKTSGKALDKEAFKRKHVADMKAKAMKTRVVTITNNDPAENSVLTADYFSFENQFFGKAVIVPFNTPVELPQGIIDVIKNTPLTIHSAEYKNGKHTGNASAKLAKKYSVSYEEQ